MRSFRYTISRHRRLIAAALAALATASALTALSPPPPPTTHILTAARDLPSGPLHPDDLVLHPFPPTAVPDGALRSPDAAKGRILAAPVRRGEPITDARLLGPALLATYGPNTVATPIRLADAETAKLLSPGDIINVLATSTAWEGPAALPAQTIAENVPVIATPHSPTPTGLSKPETGALIILATTPDQAAHLATAQAGGHLSITINSR